MFSNVENSADVWELENTSQAGHKVGVPTLAVLPYLDWTHEYFSHQAWTCLLEPINKHLLTDALGCYPGSRIRRNHYNQVLKKVVSRESSIHEFMPSLSTSSYWFVVMLFIIVNLSVRNSSACHWTPVKLLVSAEHLPKYNNIILLITGFIWDENWYHYWWHN